MPFYWGGHKSCQVHAFTFLPLLALTMETFKDTEELKVNLLLLASFDCTHHDVTPSVCLRCRAGASRQGWLLQLGVETSPYWSY